MKIKDRRIISFETIHHNGHEYRRYGPSHWEKSVGADWEILTHPMKLEKAYQFRIKGETATARIENITPENKYNETISIRLTVDMPWADKQWIWQNNFKNIRIIETLRPLPRDRELVPNSAERTEVQKIRRISAYNHFADILRSAFREIIEKQDPINGYEQEELNCWKAADAETVPHYDPEDCEYCLMEAEEEDLEYEANFTWHDDGWHCDRCGRVV